MGPRNIIVLQAAAAAAHGQLPGVDARAKLQLLSFQQVMCKSINTLVVLYTC
jgi:hypothetical protein